MAVLSSILAALQILLCGISAEEERSQFWLECHQIGDNVYTCDGGRL